MDTQAIIAQLSNAVIALIILVLGAIGAYIVDRFKLQPARLRMQMDEYKADREQERKQEQNEAAIAIEKARTDNLRDTAASTVFQDIGRGYLATVPILQQMSDVLKTSGGDQSAMKATVEAINNTLKTGSEPIQAIAKKLDEVYEILKRLEAQPHLTPEQVAQLDTVTNRMGELAKEFEQRKHDSKPLPVIVIEQPNGKEQ